MTINSTRLLARTCLAALLASAMIAAEAASAQFVGAPGKNPEALDEALQAAARLRIADREIGRKWDALGGSPGAPRVPGEAGLIAVGDGYYREYSKAGDRIYYRPGTAPLFIYGAIGDKYIKAGGPVGWLGWPSAEEEPFPSGGRAVSFQNGGIYYWPDTGAIDVGNVIVRYSGLYAFGETDNDSGSQWDISGEYKDGDEPYLIFSVIGGKMPQPTVTKTQVYKHVRPKNARPDNLELYRGAPLGAGITAVLFEEDFGDASKMRDTINEGVQSAHLAGLGALASAGPIGVAGAAVLEAGWQLYGDEVKEFIGDSADLEDDRLQAQAVFISAKQMILLSRAPKNNHQGISWQVETPLFSAEGGSWKAYFIVEEETRAAPPPLADRAPAPAPAVAATQLFWPTRQDIARTPWAFADLNAVGWAQASRAAAQLCHSTPGFAAGHFNGHQDLGKGTYGLQCSGIGAIWRDVTAAEIAATQWSFTDVNRVTWAQANRAAERLCASANQGFAGGHLNGQQADGRYGLFCYRDGAKWFDATDAELAATGWGFPTPRLDDVAWAQAMRAATGFCQGKGFDGGFMNGHQAPNKYGVVCQKASS